MTWKVDSLLLRDLFRVDRSLITIWGGIEIMVQWLSSVNVLTDDLAHRSAMQEMQFADVTAYHGASTEISKFTFFNFPGNLEVTNGILVENDVSVGQDNTLSMIEW